MVKNTEQITVTDKIVWAADAVEFLFGEKGRLRLPYRTIMIAAVKINKNGEIIIPMLRDIESSADGKLMIGNTAGKIFELDISETKNTAGETLITLAEYCPWTWIGGHRWLESGDAQAWKSLADYYRSFSLFECSLY